MLTKVLNIKDYRKNLAKIWKDSQKKGQRLVVMSRSKPVFEVLPLYQNYLEFEGEEMTLKERYKLAEKSFNFWKSGKDDKIFNEKISL